MHLPIEMHDECRWSLSATLSKALGTRAWVLLTLHLFSHAQPSLNLFKYLYELHRSSTRRLMSFWVSRLLIKFLRGPIFDRPRLALNLNLGDKHSSFLMRNQSTLSRAILCKSVDHFG